MTDKIAAQLRATYTRQATAFDQQRNKSLFEAKWLDAFLGHVPPGGHVLDLGCGTGEPIAGYILAQGRQVTGVDAVKPMIAMAQERLPAGRWQVGDIRDVTFNHRFDGILGWNSVFHLTRVEQHKLIPRLCAMLRPGAPIMLTTGYSDGEATGTVGGETVYHASLAPDTYADLLAQNGCRLIAHVLQDETCNNHSILMGCRNS